MIGIPRFAILALQHLYARPVIGPEAEVIGLVMPGFQGQTVGVMLVAGKARPAACADGEQLAHQKAADFAMVFGAKDMLDLAMGFGVVRTILHKVKVGGAHVKRL